MMEVTSTKKLPTLSTKDAMSGRDQSCLTSRGSGTSGGAGHMAGTSAPIIANSADLSLQGAATNDFPDSEIPLATDDPLANDNCIAILTEIAADLRWI